MRNPREKITDGGCNYHLMNRTAGGENEYPFGDVEREKGIQMIFNLAKYYLLEFTSICWMGNHFHLVAYAPGITELPDYIQIAERHNSFYKDNSSKLIELNDIPACRKAAQDMGDISHFMKALQQSYTCYFNKTHNRHGRLWAGRFKSTIIDGHDGLMTVLKYVDLNPVRAGLVAAPADYRHSSWGWLCGSGKHPFETSFLKHLRGAIGHEITKDWSDEQLLGDYRCELARTITYEKTENSKVIEAAMQKARKNETMPVKFLRRMRHITDGGIIGSKLFVQETAAKFREGGGVMKKKFSHGKNHNGIDLYCYKQLRSKT